MDRQFVSFENSDNLTLKGVLLNPTKGPANKSLGFIYLPGIVLGALSVHKLGFKIGEVVTSMGYQLLLFDQAGIGESEGSFPEGLHEEVAHWVAQGSLVGSTLEVIDWARSRLGVDKIVLIGHCGGALTSAYCAARHSGVGGVILISPPPMEIEMGHSRLARHGVADEYFSLYFQKLFSRQSWLRLFSGATDYRTLTSVIWSKVSRPFKAKPAAVPVADNNKHEEKTVGFNPLLVEALGQVLAMKKPLEVIYGDKDADMEDFRRFHKVHLSDLAPLVVIENTSHGFTFNEAQNRLLEEISLFVARVAAS